MNQPTKRRGASVVIGLFLLLVAIGGLAVWLMGQRTPTLTSEAIAQMNRGVGLLEEYQYLDAFKAFDALAREYPGWEAVHVNRGIAAFNLQEQYLKVAEESFDRALAINPRSPHALLSLAELRGDLAID